MDVSKIRPEVIDISPATGVRDILRAARFMVEKYRESAVFAGHYTHLLTWAQAVAFYRLTADLTPSNEFEPR
jgi:hypothetical protein